MSIIELDIIEEVLGQDLSKDQMVEALQTLDLVTIASPNRELFAQVAIPEYHNHTDLTPEELLALKTALSKSNLVEDDFSSTFLPEIYAKSSLSSNSFRLEVTWYQHIYTYKYSPKTKVMFILCENKNIESNKNLGRKIEKNVPFQDANIILLLRDLLLSKQAEKR